MITIKNDKEIEKMKAAGRLVGECHNLLRDMIKPGITTMELNDVAEKYFRDHGAYPTFLGYGGFPYSICASVNEEVVHGFPSDRVLEEGDIISIDLGATLDGYVGDAARTWGVGKISDEAQKLIDVTRESFFTGIKQAHVGNRLSDIATLFRKWRKMLASLLCATMSGTGSAVKCTKIRQFRITANRAMVLDFSKT